MHSDSAGSIKAVILGNDAVLAARPAEPIQLARACLRIGFDFVAPVSWGEELLATRVADVIAERHPSAVVIANCPFVAESLRRRLSGVPCVASVSPPVATARYLRAAMSSRALHITYVGACPGAASEDIDASMLPDVLLSRLIEAGVDIERLPFHLEGQIPPDRSRYSSIPGGVPHPGWLADRTGAIEVEVAPRTADAVATMYAERPIALDLEAACGCACARDRVAMARIDPPRSAAPVVLPLKLDLADGRLLPADRSVDQEGTPGEADAVTEAGLEARMRELRATFLERGLSNVDVLRPAEPLTSLRFSASLEPWTVATDRPGPAADVQSSLETVPHADAPPAVRPTPPFTGRLSAMR